MAVDIRLSLKEYGRLALGIIDFKCKIVKSISVNFEVIEAEGWQIKDFRILYDANGGTYIAVGHKSKPSHIKYVFIDLSKYLQGDHTVIHKNRLWGRAFSINASLFSSESCGQLFKPFKHSLRAEKEPIILMCDDIVELHTAPKPVDITNYSEYYAEKFYEFNVTGNNGVADVVDESSSEADETSSELVANTKEITNLRYEIKDVLKKLTDIEFECDILKRLSSGSKVDITEGFEVMKSEIENGIDIGGIKNDISKLRDTLNTIAANLDNNNHIYIDTMCDAVKTEICENLSENQQKLLSQMCDNKRSLSDTLTEVIDAACKCVHHSATSDIAELQKVVTTELKSISEILSLFNHNILTIRDEFKNNGVTKATDEVTVVNDSTSTDIKLSEIDGEYLSTSERLVLKMLNLGIVELKKMFSDDNIALLCIDGSYLPQTKNSGYAYSLIYNGEIIDMYGKCTKDCNSPIKAEGYALKRGLAHVSADGLREVYVVYDSLDMMSKINDTSTELSKYVARITEGMTVHWIKVQAHTGIPVHTHVDVLSGMASGRKI